MARAKVTAQKPGTAWLFHLFYFSSTGLLAAFLEWGLGANWGYIAMVLLWLPSIGLIPWVWLRLSGQEVELHGLAMLMILLSWAGVVTHVGAVHLLWSYSTIPAVAARDLPQHPDPLVVHVRDGNVQTKYAYLHTSRHYDSRRSTTTITHTCVAPITPTGWTPDQTVPLWAVCPDSPSECRQCPDWRRPDADLIPTLAWGESAAHVAAHQAAQRHGLHLSEPVRIALWVRSAEDGLVSRVLVAVASIWGIFLLWGVCATIARWWR